MRARTTRCSCGFAICCLRPARRRPPILDCSGQGRRRCRRCLSINWRRWSCGTCWTAATIRCGRGLRSYSSAPRRRRSRPAPSCWPATRPRTRLGGEGGGLTEERGGGLGAGSARHDMVLDFTFARLGQDAFARVIEAWLRHLLGIEVSVQPVQTIRDERWAWHVGLDAEASALMNELYESRSVAQERPRHIPALLRLEF